jgi:cob(I)alamin adenosyltransferase
MSSESHIPKIYTRTGDKGKTSLIGGSRVAKSHLRLEAYGTLDELNSALGVVAAIAQTLTLTSIPKFSSVTAPQSLHTPQQLHIFILEIQCDLFNLGSQLACEDENIRARMPHLADTRIEELEKLIDECTVPLKPLKNFILPGGSQASAFTHIARTICRRAERIAVVLSEEAEVAPVNIAYLNRLSDLLFVLARYFNFLLEIEEPIWRASGKQKL